MRKKGAITTWAFLNSPRKEPSETLKTSLNKLGENENDDV